jgi:NAD+ kinase
MHKKQKSTQAAPSGNTTPAYRRVGLIVKHHHPEAAQFALEIGNLLISRGCEVAFADESSRTYEAFVRANSKEKGSIRLLPKAKIVEASDLIVVLGGDGTFLSVAREMRAKSVPLLGINMGQLGFLTEFKKSEAVPSLTALLNGQKPQMSERTLLEVTLKRKNKVIFQGPVVNDAVISKGAIARIIEVQVAVGGRWAHNVKADGIIVSTPTGSTAYSLAAGGPIMEPSLPAVILTPICAHSLTQRPLVIPDHSEIELKLSQRPGHVLLTLDGQDAVDMNEDDVVTVRRYHKHSLLMISSPTRDYFSLLREKLKFGMRD